MPASLIKSFADKSGKSEKEVDKVFQKAKDIVLKQYANIDDNSSKFFALVTTILKKMLGISENYSFKTYVKEKELFIKSVPPAKINIPTGLFTMKAVEISDFLVKNSDSLAQAQSRLNFFINRAGKNLSNETELEKAKKLISKAFEEK